MSTYDIDIPTQGNCHPQTISPSLSLAPLPHLRYNQNMNNNWDILGHEWAVNILKKSLEQGRVRHAYLLTGPDGVGRRTLALRLAQALNCQQSSTPGMPCGICRDCLLFYRQQHPDLTIITVGEGEQSIKVDQVREAQHALNLTPYQATYRVAILLNFQLATLSAANALLKTLEEPPPQVVMLLTAQDPEALLPTISSRCELIRLRPLSLSNLSKRLHQTHNIPEQQARLLAHVAGGRPGFALKMHQNPDELQRRVQWLDDLMDLINSSRLKRFDYAEILAKDRDRIPGQLSVWSSFWRDVLLVSSQASVPFTNIDRIDQITDLARKVESRSAREIVEEIEHTIMLISQNINPRLALENLLLRFTI